MFLYPKIKIYLLFLIFPFLSCKQYVEDLHSQNKYAEAIHSQNEKPAISGHSNKTFVHPDHIIFVWFENKKYSSIVGSPNAPYINSLIAKGTLFTNMFAITHPSYPNYVDFFAGQPNGITNDNCINTTTLTTSNLYTNLSIARKSFAWYSEGLPSSGSTICQSGYYVEKHNPITVFANVPVSRNKTFASFPADYSKLENVVCITPNLIDDMHDGSVLTGDQWLKTHLSVLAEWCSTHNSIFVVYFDENDGTGTNQIPVIAFGQHVKVNYKEATLYDHYNWTRTICAMFFAPNTWTTNLNTRHNIDGCWK